jgi:acid phosphatase (class A)
MRGHACLAGLLSAGLGLGSMPVVLVQIPARSQERPKVFAAPAVAGPQLLSARYQGVIGRPPAPGSQAELEDLVILRWNQRTQTPEGILHSWRFLNRNLSVFDAAVGSDLAKTAPTLFKALTLYLIQVDAVKDQLKDSVARPRPFVTHGEFRPCLPIEKSWSFPSGHATWFATAGLLLADLLPERRERILAVGWQGGYARSYCAVHYPSDVKASQQLAMAISRDVITSPEWRSFKQHVSDERQRLLVAPPAGLPLLFE